MALSLKSAVAPYHRPLPPSACLLLGACSLALSLPSLGEVPGLHGDEAWVGLRAAALLRGEAHLSWTGMNAHTGPLHQLLVAASFAAFGPTTIALRLVGAAANAVGVGLYAWVTGQLLGRLCAALATLLLLTAPWFCANARVATEHAALAAPLALGAVACLLRARRPSRLKAQDDPSVAARPGDHQARRRWALAAGVLLGLGTWNHLVFVAVPATLLTLALLRLGLRAWRCPEVGWTAFGWACVTLGPLTALGGKLRLQGGGSAALARLRELPVVVAQLWQGDVVALRLAGAVAASSGRFATVLLGVAAAGALAQALDVGPKARRARLALVAAVGLAATTAVAVPAHAERHLLLPMLLMPWIVAVGLVGLAEASGRRGPQLAAAGVLAVACVQLNSSYLNVLAPLRAHEAVARTYQFGRQEETSNHARDVRGLYAELVARGPELVLAHHFIAAPLRFYDLAESRLQVHEVPVAHAAAAAVLAAAAPSLRQVAGGPLLVAYGDEWPQLAPPLAEALPQLPARAERVGPFCLVRLAPPS